MEDSTVPGYTLGPHGGSFRPTGDVADGPESCGADDGTRVFDFHETALGARRRSSQGIGKMIKEAIRVLESGCINTVSPKDQDHLILYRLGYLNHLICEDALSSEYLKNENF